MHQRVCTYESEDVEELNESIINYVYDFGGDLSKICINRYAIAFLLRDDVRIQVVPRMGKDAVSIVREFDLDCLEAYYDGDALHYTDNAMRAWRERVNFYAPEHESCSYSTDIWSYFRIGYDFYISSKYFGGTNLGVRGFELEYPKKSER